MTLLVLADTAPAQQSKFYTRPGENQVFPQIKGKFSSVILCKVADALTRGLPSSYSMSPSFWQGLCYSPPRALRRGDGPREEVARLEALGRSLSPFLTVILSAVSHDREILKV